MLTVLCTGPLLPEGLHLASSIHKPTSGAFRYALFYYKTQLTDHNKKDRPKLVGKKV